MDLHSMLIDGKIVGLVGLRTGNVRRKRERLIGGSHAIQNDGDTVPAAAGVCVDGQTNACAFFNQSR